MIEMQPPIPIARLVMDVLKLSRESGGYREFISKFGEYVQTNLGINEVIVKDGSQSQQFSPIEETALNTNKPYTENGLSGYSATELIEYSNRGYKCCAILPISKDGKVFGTITMLSKDEAGFAPDHSTLFSIASEIVSSEAGSKYERDKSFNVAKYFDASFSNMMPQLLISSEGSIIRANKPALNCFDRNQKELYGAKLSDIFELDKQSVELLNKGSIIEAGLKADQGKSFEISPSRINESLLHLMINETSKAKEAEERSKLIDRSNDQVFMTLDKDLSISWISSASNSMFGINGDLLVGKRFTDFIKVPTTISDIMQKLSGTRYYGQITLSFGNDAELNANLSAYKSSGRIYCIISKDYERILRFAQGMTDDVIGLSNDPMIEIDKSGYIVSHNSAAETLFKLGNGTEGTQIYSLCADDESRAKIATSLSVAANNGYIRDVYVNMIELKDRTEVPCVQTVKAILDANGRASKFLLMSKELLTKRRIEQIEDAKERAEDEVKKFKAESELKSQFIYNISHDLKTPITNIMGFSKLLLTDGSDTLSKEQKDYIQIIYDESERFLELVKQVLDVAKLQSGIVKLDLQQVNFNEIKNNPSIKSLAEACQNKGLEFSWVVDYDVPEITADPNRVIQVFSNLIGNAIKFTEKGSISIRVSRKKGSVSVDVSDTGIGISKSDIPKIFKKFYQLKRGLIKQEGSGTGLGLSIVSEIVHLHHGQVRVVDSDVGKGTTFRFTLPIKPKIPKKTLKYNKAEHQADAI
jgi:signal transduction histidine kinase